MLYFHFSRCVANLRPLLDSGTMGTKGHTETTVPHLTESYNSHVSALFVTVTYHVWLIPQAPFFLYFFYLLCILNTSDPLESLKMHLLLLESQTKNVAKMIFLKTFTEENQN